MLGKELPAALDQLTQKGHIAPTDLAQAAIGPGMQIYSRYSRVETISGEPVSVREALVAINRAIADYDERQEGDLDSESPLSASTGSSSTAMRKARTAKQKRWHEPKMSLSVSCEMMTVCSPLKEEE